MFCVCSQCWGVNFKSSLKVLWESQNVIWEFYFGGLRLTFLQLQNPCQVSGVPKSIPTLLIMAKYRYTDPYFFIS